MNTQIVVISIVEYYSTIKSSKLLMHKTTWPSFRGILPRKRSQYQKVMDAVTPFIWHFLESKVMGMENRPMVARG